MSTILSNTANYLLNGATGLASGATTLATTTLQRVKDGYETLKSTATKAHDVGTAAIEQGKQVVSNVATSVRNGLAAAGSALRTNPTAIPEFVAGAYDALNRSAEELFGSTTLNENDAELAHEFILANNDGTFTPPNSPSVSRKNSVTGQSASQRSSDRRVKLLAFLGFLVLLINCFSILIQRGTKAAHNFLSREMGALENFNATLRS